MKSLYLSLFFLLGNLSIYAQKSFIFVSASHYYNTEYNIRLSGNLPSTMKNYYSQTEIAEVLNELSDNGYELTSNYAVGNTSVFLFSKDRNQSANAIRSVKATDDSEVYEVARYNLQGLPINENEKGIQIIVYSNYTTKTIIRE